MKRSFPLISLFVLGCAVLGLNACGGNEPEPQKANLTITPEGGTISLKNGVTIVVPSGAVNSDTEVTVEYLEDLDESTGSLPSDVQGLVKFTPEGLVFNKPIQVTIPLNQPAAERTDIVYWSSSDGRWYITDRGEVNGKEVQFYIEHFSTYASMGGAWGDLFSMMDAKVGGAQTQAEVNGALNSFLADNMWEEMGMKDFHWSTRAEMGGGAVSTCAQCCGLFASWMSQEGGNDRQGAARYKEQSTHNIVTNIALSNAAMSAHLKSEYQVAADRIIEIYGEPCPAALSGQAAKSTIEKGKTTEVTITASCDGSPLADQLLEFSCSPELSCQTRNQRTDGNGQVTITVKGEEEGTGTVYVKALNAMDNAYDSETTVSVKVGEGDTWEVMWIVNVYKSATASDFTPTAMGEGLGVANISVQNTTHSLSYDIVGSATFSIKNNRAKGKFYLSVENVQYDLPEWKASWNYLGNDGTVVGNLVYNVPFDVQYKLQPKKDVSFQSVYDKYVSIYLTEDGKEWDEDVLLKDNTTVTSTYIKSYIDGSVTDASLTTPKLYDFMSGIRPFAINLTLEEGSFDLVCDEEISPKPDANGRYNRFSLWGNDFDFPYDNFSILFTNEITGSVSTSKSATGSVTIRRVDKQE